MLAASLGASDIVLVSSIKGGFFVLVTGTALFLVADRFLLRQRAAEDRQLELQREQANINEQAIRQGYVDVLDAVTGGRLVLMSEEELKGALGTPVLPPQQLSDPIELCTARSLVGCVPEILGLPERDAFVLAVSEALTNALKHGQVLKHGQACEYGVYRTAEAVQVVIGDSGPGIDFRMLPKSTLIQGFSTTKTMGLGFTIMLDVCDRVLLSTSARGTMLVLELGLADARHA